MNENVATAIARLQESGLAPVGDARGCSPAVIAGIEQKIGARLPATYREFLAYFGVKAGSFMRGSLFLCKDLGSLAFAAPHLAKAEGVVLPRTAFVFWMHGGYACLYFLLDDGDDPEVYSIVEDEGMKPLRMSFSTWLLTAADEEIALHEEIKE